MKAVNYKDGNVYNNDPSNIEIVDVNTGITCATCKSEFPSYLELTAHIGNPPNDATNSTIKQSETDSKDGFDDRYGQLLAAEQERFKEGLSQAMRERAAQMAPDELERWIESLPASEQDEARKMFNRTIAMASITAKIGQIAALMKDVREYKAAHPELITGYYLNSYGSLLNAYREGDLSFEDCVALLAQVDQSKRSRDDSICDDVDSILPIVKELTEYQALVYVALYKLDILDAESAIKLVVKYAKLIEDYERRRFEPIATARAIMEQEASSQATPAPSHESEARTRDIIKRISDAAIELAFVRHSLTNDEFDETNYPDAPDGVEAIRMFVEEIKIDTLNCLTGDDTACFDPEDLDETNCELLWLQKVLGDTIPRSIFESHTKAVGEFLSEMSEIHSLDALEPVPVRVKEVTQSLLRVSREIRERMATVSSDTFRLDWLKGQSKGYGNGWIVRRRSEGGIALHESHRDNATATGPREAIDEAMKEGKL